MHTEIDTIKITMTVQEAREFSEQMAIVFAHFEAAVNAVANTTIEQLMLDYPAVSKFYQMLKIYSNPKQDLPF